MICSRRPVDGGAEGGCGADGGVLPGGGVRPDEQLRRDRAGAAGPRRPRRVHHRGVLRRHPRGARVRGAADAPRAAAGGGGGAGPVLEGLHRRTSPEFRKPTIEQLETFIAPTMGALVEARGTSRTGCARSSTSCSPRSWSRTTSARSRRCRPVRGDGRGSSRATRPRSWIRRSPPVFSGYAAGDRAGWDEFWAAYDRHLGPLWTGFDEFCRERGAPALAPRAFIHESPDLNLYLYPAEADYPRERPLGPTWHRIDTCVREEAGEAELPDDIRHGDGIADLPVARLARLGRRRPDAAALRRPGRARRTATSSRRARRPTRSRSATASGAPSICPSRS